MRKYDLNNPQKWFVLSFQPELQYVTKLLRKSGVYMVVVCRTEDDGGGGAAAQEDQDDPSDDPKEGTEEGPKQNIELYQLLEQPLGLRQITDTSNATIFYGDNHNCLAVCSDNWDSLPGGCMYMEHVCVPSAGKDMGDSCYGIYFIKLDDGKSKLVVRDLGERSRLWLAAPAMWFQPSFV